MEKKIVDIETLTEKELLNEFADRFLAYEESALKMWEFRNGLGYSEEDCECAEPEVADRWDELKTEHDDDFCRCREVVRFVKGDKTLLEC